MIKKVLLYIWQLPQHLLGLFLFVCYRNCGRFKYRGKIYQYSDNIPGAISLGNYIITGSKRQITLDHEYGHTVQSKKWGPLYLIIVGITSLYHTQFTPNDKYYTVWPENEADKLGGVIRDKYGKRKTTYEPTAEEREIFC